MKLFYAILMILTLYSCKKEKREKKTPKVLTWGYDGGSYREVSNENVSTSPIYIVDVTSTSKQNYLKYYLVKAYHASGNSYKLSESVTFCFEATGISFEIWDNALRNVMCQVKRNDDEKYYRITKGYVKGIKNSANVWDISFDLTYDPDIKKYKETRVTSWD